MGVRITGGIGDQIVIARYLRDLLAAAGPHVVDIYTSNVVAARWVFAHDPHIGGIRDYGYVWKRVRAAYPVSLEVSQFVQARYRDAGPVVRRICDRLDAFGAEHRSFIEHHPLLDNQLALHATEQGRARRDFLHTMSGLEYGGDRYPLLVDGGALARFGLAAGGYVTVHNGFDPDFSGRADTSTKVYGHFGGLVALVKARFPNLQTVQLGTTTSRPIAGVDRMLVGQTTLAEAAALIGGARLHIDNEGGLVHLASCLGTRACVLFGPTSLDYFAYPENINIAPATCGNCWWLTADWMNRCMKGYSSAACLNEIDPASVFRRIEAALADCPAASQPSVPAGRCA